MTTFLLLLILAIGVVVAATWELVHELRSDGYGHHPAPRSHEYEGLPAPSHRGLGYPY